MRITPGLVNFVTGGAQGLGKGFVQRLHARGARVAVADHNLDAMNALRKELGGDTERLLTIQCDVTQKEQIDNAVEETHAKWGGIHVCLTGAGIVGMEHMPNVTVDSWKKHMDINLFGTFFTAQACLAKMMENKPNEDGQRGAVIMISSVCGTDGNNVGQTPYSATKGAINGLTLPMAREMGPHGIRVVTIAPGPIRTEMQEKLASEIPGIEFLNNQMNEMTPVGRMGSVEEFAMMAEHCVENGYLNATTVRLDGGMRFASFKFPEQN